MSDSVFIDCSCGQVTAVRLHADSDGQRTDCPTCGAPLYAQAPTPPVETYWNDDFDLLGTDVSPALPYLPTKQKQ